jgi:hypothetical protein
MALSITHSYVSAVPDAGDASLVQPSDWNDTHDISGLAAGIEDFLATPSSANLKTAVTDETGSGALVFANTPTLVTPVLGVATGSTLTLTQGTITDPATMISGTVTWNDAADTFTAWNLNVTSTASGANSLLIDLQTGGTSFFNVGKAGSVRLGEGIAGIPVGGTSFQVWSGGSLGFSSTTNAQGTGDVFLARDAANTLALRNGTTAQRFNLYKTYTDASNYEVLSTYISGNIFYLEARAAGSGTVRSLRLSSGDTPGGDGYYLNIGGGFQFSRSGVGDFWALNSSGHFTPSGDNVYDLGTSGTKVRTGYFGTSVVTPIATITQGTITDVAPLLNMTSTWNDAADTFTAIKLNVTSTASAAASLLMDLQLGGTSVFNITKAGDVRLVSATNGTTATMYTSISGPAWYVSAASNEGFGLFGNVGFGRSIRLDSVLSLAWNSGGPSSGADVGLWRDAAATLALRNGTNAQEFRVYSTYTDSSNYERINIGGGTFPGLYFTAAGSGSARNLYIINATNGELAFYTNNTRRWYLQATGHLIADTDNTLDIGASGATRPRTGYFGTSVVIAGNTAITGGTHTIAVPAGAMFAAATSGAASASLDSGSEDVNYQVFDFDASADEYVHFTIPMPKGWDEGTVTYQVLWSSTATDTDGVAWGLQGVAVSDNDAINAAYGTPIVVTDDAQSAAGELYVTAVSSAVTIGGSPAAGDMVFFRLFRDVSDANDDMTEDARLLGVRILYTVNAANDA